MHSSEANSSEKQRQLAISSWRNAALDCIDVLHWDANGTIAKLKGAEHPTVLHLHLSRVILLAPHQEIRRHAARLVAAASSSRDATENDEGRFDGTDTRKGILQWLHHDEVRTLFSLQAFG